MKKVLSLFLAVMMVITMLPVAAFADELELFPVGEAPFAEAPAKEEKPAEEPAETEQQEEPTAISDEPVVLSDRGIATIDAPAGSTISFVTGASYSHHKFIKVISVESNDSGVTAKFELPSNTDAFYRVQNPDGITYWNFGNWNNSVDITVTAEDLYIGSSEYTKNIVYYNSEKNDYDVAGIYLNIN